MYAPFQTNQVKCINIPHTPHFSPHWFENYTLKGGTYPYGHLRRIPTPLPGSLSAVLLSISDFFVQKYLVDYQVLLLLLPRSLQIFNYLANKENKVPFEEKIKSPTPLPSCVQRYVQLRGETSRQQVDKMRLAMKLASLFVMYFCSLFSGTAEQL